MKQGLPDLETAIATMNVHNHNSVDWSRVQYSVYLIHQHLRYEYPGPINDLRQHLMILPPIQHGDQRRVEHRLTVTNLDVKTVYQYDAFGNPEINLLVPHVEQAIDFEAWILVERDVERGPHYLSSDWLTDSRLLQPSELTHPGDGLREVAAMLQADGRRGIDLVEHINNWVYQFMCYSHDITDIHTTAAQVFALRHGVCQDYAHVMLALCHLCAIPARYVSGHLLGEGGTHAWVEVLLPVLGQPGKAQAIAFDPTHGRRAGMSYVTIAVGRDYFDVAPTSGTYRASYSGQLSARKVVGLSMYEYDGFESQAS
ncbi:MAG: transglutaminase family protein [Ktedonobacteraceae bacterium]